MSKADVEVVRDALGHNNPRTLENRKLIEDIFHPELVFTSSLTSVDMRTFHGYDGVVDYLEEMASAFDEWSQDAVEFMDTGTVVATWWFEARGRNSGATVRSRIAGVFDVDDGRVRRVHAFLDPADAYTAAGLDPPQHP